MKKNYALIICLLLTTLALQAQIISTNPTFPTENDEITLIFDATKGNAGLKGFTGDVYAHTGVITNKSTSDSDWKYAPTWGNNAAKYKLTSLGNDKWSLKITPNLRSYYGVPAGESIRKMAFVFRSANNSREGKDVGNKDIFVEVYDAALSVRFDEPAEKLLVSIGSSVTIKASASAASDLKLYVNNAQVASASNATSISHTYNFATSGTFTLKAEATLNGQTVANTQTVSVISTTSQTETLPKGVRPGINYINDTDVTLVLQAPKKQYVYVVGDFNDWTPATDFQMKKDGEFFWLELKGLTQGEEYAFQYLVDGSIYVADPYTDKVLDPWNDPYIDNSTYPNLKAYPTGKAEGIVSVLQPGQTPYKWEVTNFKRPETGNLIIYEMLLRDFTAEHTFNAAKEKLAYLKTLGVNAIELMPVNEFEGNISWGYNPSFYFAVDKYYGTKNDMKAFVDECHKQGMAVIIDLVLNHSFGQSPFYLLYKDADSKPSADNPWYNRESNIKNTSLAWGYDFNHDSEYTRALVDSVAGFWMSEYKVDGFRYDFTKGFSNTYYGPSDWANGPDLARIANLKRMANEVWKRESDAYVIFEHLAAFSEEKQLGEAGILLWRNMNHAYCQTAMGYSSESDFSGLYAAGGSASMPWGSLIGYMESHDEERMGFKAWKWGAVGVRPTTATNAANSPSTGSNANLSVRTKRLATNAAFLLMVPGPKMIWQFGELGYDFSINNNSTGTLYAEAYRTDPKPLRWDYLEDSDRKKLYDTYSSLLDLRASYPELFTATASFSWKVSQSAWDSGRTLSLTSADGTKSLLIVGNYTFADKNISASFPKTGEWYEPLNENMSLTVATQNQSLNIPAHGFRLFTSFKPILTDIKQPAETDEWGAYYDRSSDELVIPNGDCKKIEIYSVSGTLVMIQENSSVAGLSTLPPGYYIARVFKNTGNSVSCKIVK